MQERAAAAASACRLRSSSERSSSSAFQLDVKEDIGVESDEEEIVRVPRICGNNSASAAGGTSATGKAPASDGVRSRGQSAADKEGKKLKRLLRNRVSAQQARERKKAYLSDLEMRATNLEKRNSELEEKLSTLQNENQMLRHGHPATKELWNKPFPHFNELTFVFGKDRVTRAGVETPSDMTSNDVKPFGADEEMDASPEPYVLQPHLFDDATNLNEEENSETSTSGLQRSAMTSRESKRKRTSYHSEMLDVVRMALDMQNSQLERIASWPISNYAFEENRCKQVSNILSQLTPTLSKQDRIMLMDILFTNVRKIGSFLSVPMEDKWYYCMYLLGRRE